MTVSLALTAKTVKDAVAVPSAAVFKNADGAYYVLLAGTDQKAHQKPVQLGAKNAELTQIANGIQAGDPVITAGGYAVPDGTAIKIEKGAESKAGDASKEDDAKGSTSKPQRPQKKNPPATSAKEKD